MSKDTSPSLKKVDEEEEPMCSICCEELTVKNIVNPECGHATCKDCFWRWAKDKNSCPFCRTNLLKNTEEAQEIQQMRNLLQHRTRIVRQVESAYDEEDRIKAGLRRLKRSERTVRNDILKFEKLKKEEHQKLMQIKKANGGTYQTFVYFKEKMVSTMIKNRLHRDYMEGTADDCGTHSLPGPNEGMCKGVLRDIDIIGRSVIACESYRPLLDKVREINKVRGDRESFRQSMLPPHLMSGYLGLDRLFREEEQQDILPVRHNLEQAFVEYISTLDNNANPRINAEHFLNNVIQGLLDNSNNIVGPGGPDFVDTSGNTYELATVTDFSSPIGIGSGSELDDMPELETMSDSDMSIDSDNDIPELE
jgi:hypothetical protein